MSKESFPKPVLCGFSRSIKTITPTLPTTPMKPWRESKEVRRKLWLIMWEKHVIFYLKLMCLIVELVVNDLVGFIRNS